MNILVACEESQRVCKAFRDKGHTAYSCDIIPTSGYNPEWHIQQDVTPLINGNCTFRTADGAEHTITGKWDMIIAFPPCTYLTNAGNAYFNVEKYGDKARERLKNREEAYNFFMLFANADCEKIAIENPVGYMNGHYKKPTQIIEPYYFAEDENDFDNYQKKRTCLWLKNLPALKKKKELPMPQPTYIDKSGKHRYYTDAISGRSKDAQIKRSKTFQGVADAMAEQWG